MVLLMIFNLNRIYLLNRSLPFLGLFINIASPIKRKIFVMFQPLKPLSRGQVVSFLQAEDDEEAIEIEEEKEKSLPPPILSSSNNFLFPWTSLGQNTQRLKLHPTAIEIIKLFFNKKVKSNYNNYTLIIDAKDVRDFLWEKNLLPNRSAAYVKPFTLILNYFRIKNLIPHHFSSHQLMVLIFSSTIGLLEPSASEEALSSLLKEWQPKVIQQSFLEIKPSETVKEKSSFCQNPPSVSKKGKEPLLKSLTSFSLFLKTSSPNNLIISIDVEKVHEWFKLKDLPIDQISEFLNQLIFYKDVFHWELVKEKKNEFYYVAFSPFHSWELTFLLKFYFLSRKGIFSSDDECVLDVTHVASLLGVPELQINTCLNNLEATGHIKLLETHSHLKNLKKFKIFNN